MKKLVLFFSVAAALMAVSCNKNEKGEVLSPDEQKATVVEVCTEAAKQIELKNWQSTAVLASFSVDAISHAKPSEGVENYAQILVGKWEKASLIDLQDVKGAFSIDGTGVITRNNANDLTLSYAAYDSFEAEAKPVACVATVSVKNSGNKIVVVKAEEGTDAITKEEQPKDVMLAVPSSVNFNIKADGKQEFALGVNDIKIGGLNNGVPGIDGTYSFTAALTAGQYKLAITKAKYSTKEIGLGINFSNSGKSIIKANFSATGEIPVEEGDPIIENITGKANASITLLDQISLKGKIDYTGIVNLAKLSGEAFSDPKTVEEGQAVVDAMLKYVDLGIYMKNACQGKLTFLVSEETSPDPEDGTYIYVAPAIKFTDGSETMLAADYGYSLLGEIMSSDYILGVVAEISQFIEQFTGEGDE